MAGARLLRSLRELKISRFFKRSRPKAAESTVIVDQDFPVFGDSEQLVHPVDEERTSTSAMPQQTLASCPICVSEVPRKELHKLSCGHEYCEACLVHMFKESVRDRSQMPPSCCAGECIPPTLVGHRLSAGFKGRWERRCEEWTSRQPLYCATRGCGRFIRQKYIDPHAAGSKKSK